MGAYCVRQTDLPHISRLFGDYLYAFERVQHWYAHVPLDPQSYGAAAEQIRFTPEQHHAIADALTSGNEGNPSLGLLRRPGTVAVVTGQQVGLYGGPIYTIYKALTAAKLAQRLREQGTPAVPVFWLATEDHDFAEIDHALVFDGDGRQRKLRVQDPTDLPMPVGGLAPASWPNQQLTATLSGLPYGDWVAEAVQRHYVPGASMGQAFHGLLQELLAPYGFLFLDPLRPEIRQLAAPVIARAVAQAPELSEAVTARNNELAAHGYHAQVHWEGDTSFVFLLSDKGRVALRRQNGTYSGKGVQCSADELAERGAQLSPNALLRPVVQDSLLPTVAYVGGPAEIAYFAQSQVLYERLLGRMPVMVPRACFTLVEQKVGKALQRFGLSVGDTLVPHDALRERVAGRLIPAELNDRVASTQRCLDDEMVKLRASVQRFDPTLAAALDNSERKMRYQLSKMQAKLGRELLRREAAAERAAELLHDQLYPGKTLQERIYTALPFLAQYGPDLVPTIYEQIHLECPDHIVLDL